MTDTLQDRIAKAIDGAASPITPTEAMAGHPARIEDTVAVHSSRRRRLLSVAAIALVALTGAALWIVLGNRPSAVSTTGTASQGQSAQHGGRSTAPKTGNVIPPSTAVQEGPLDSARLVADYATQSSRLPPERPDLPPLVAPLRLPAGWHFAGMTSSVSSDETSIAIDFLPPHEGSGAYRSVTVCATVNSTCATSPTETHLEAVPIHLEGFQGQIVMFGESAALRDWRGIAWTNNMQTVNW